MASMGMFSMTLTALAWVGRAWWRERRARRHWQEAARALAVQAARGWDRAGTWSGE